MLQLMEAAQYRQLHRVEWDAAQAEDFLFTLPCHVKWSAMDTKVGCLGSRAAQPGSQVNSSHHKSCPEA